MTRAFGIRLGFPIKQTLIEHLIIVSAVVTDDAHRVTELSLSLSFILFRSRSFALWLFQSFPFSQPNFCLEPFCNCFNWNFEFVLIWYHMTYGTVATVELLNSCNDVNQHLFTWQFSNTISNQTACNEISVWLHFSMVYLHDNGEVVTTHQQWKQLKHYSAKFDQRKLW